jgi:hypothetical protein
MKHVVRLLTRLYPATWRARYGEEFEALLEDTSPGWTAIFDLLKGAIRMQLSVPAFPKLAFLLSMAGLLIGLAVSFGVAPRYVSTAAMQFSPPVLNSIAPDVHPNLNQFLFQLQTEILSRTSLSSIIQDPRLDLYKEERAGTPLEDVIEKMRRKDIQIKADAPVGASRDYLAFHVTFAYPDRLKAQQTVQALITKFQDANLINQRTQARVSRAIASDQIYRLEARIGALEKRLGMPSVPHEPDFSPVPPGGIQLEVLDPPSLPVNAVSPDRWRFMASGFAAGVVVAVLIAIFRRRPPPIPFPAQTA